MKKNFSEWTDEEVKATRTSKRKIIGKTKEEYLGSKCILELMERIAGAASREGAPGQALLHPEVS